MAGDNQVLPEEVGSERTGICTYAVAVPLGGLGVAGMAEPVGEVLDEAAPARHIQHLRSPADAEQGQVCPESCTNQVELEAVPRAGAVAGFRVAGLPV
jgi:hypothetical protein